MPCQLSRLSPVLASLLAAAGIVLAVAGCGHVTPLGPTPPQPRQLGSPIILQAMRVQPAASAGGCPAGSAESAAPLGIGISWKPTKAQPAGPPTSAQAPASSACYRKLGPPVTITSAAVSPVFTFHPPPPPGSAAVPAQYGFSIMLTPAGAAALTAATTRAFHSQGYLDISVIGKTWLLPRVLQPFTDPLQIFLASRNRALELRRILVPSS